MKKCTLPELRHMAKHAKIESTWHICPVHRVHTMDDLKSQSHVRDHANIPVVNAPN